MKRYLYVPYDKLVDKERIPEEAEILSKKYHIPIRIGIEKDNIDVKNIEFITVPDRIDISYRKKGIKGLINSIDYINDFYSMNKKYKCKLYDTNNEFIFYPSAAEKNCLKFRIRINEKGSFKFYFLSDNDDIISEEYNLEIEDWNETGYNF